MLAPLSLCLILLTASHARPHWSSGVLTKGSELPPPDLVSLQQYVKEIQYSAAKSIQEASQGVQQRLAAMKKKHMDLIHQQYHHAQASRPYITNPIATPRPTWRLPVLCPTCLLPNLKLPGTFHQTPLSSGVHLPLDYSKIVPSSSAVSKPCTKDLCNHISFQSHDKSDIKPKPSLTSQSINSNQQEHNYHQTICGFSNIPLNEQLLHKCKTHSTVYPTYATVRFTTKPNPFAAPALSEKKYDSNQNVHNSLQATSSTPVREKTSVKPQQYYTLPEKLYNAAIDAATTSWKTEHTSKLEDLKTNALKLENEILGISTVKTPGSEVKIIQIPTSYIKEPEVTETTTVNMVNLNSIGHTTEKPSITTEKFNDYLTESNGIDERAKFTKFNQHSNSDSNSSDPGATEYFKGGSLSSSPKSNLITTVKDPFDLTEQVTHKSMNFDHIAADSTKLEFETTSELSDIDKGTPDYSMDTGYPKTTQYPTMDTSDALSMQEQNKWKKQDEVLSTEQIHSTEFHEKLQGKLENDRNINVYDLSSETYNKLASDKELTTTAFGQIQEKWKGEIQNELSTFGYSNEQQNQSTNLDSSEIPQLDIFTSTNTEEWQHKQDSFTQKYIENKELPDQTTFSESYERGQEVTHQALLNELTTMGDSSKMNWEGELVKTTTENSKGWSTQDTDSSLNTQPGRENITFVLTTTNSVFEENWKGKSSETTLENNEDWTTQVTDSDFILNPHLGRKNYADQSQTSGSTFEDRINWEEDQSTTFITLKSNTNIGTKDTGSTENNTSEFGKEILTLETKLDYPTKTVIIEDHTSADPTTNESLLVTLGVVNEVPQLSREEVPFVSVIVNTTPSNLKEEVESVFAISKNKNLLGTTNPWKLDPIIPSTTFTENWGGNIKSEETTEQNKEFSTQTNDHVISEIPEFAREGIFESVTIIPNFTHNLESESFKTISENNKALSTQVTEHSRITVSQIPKNKTLFQTTPLSLNTREQENDFFQTTTGNTEYTQTSTDHSKDFIDDFNNRAEIDEGIIENEEMSTFGTTSITGDINQRATDRSLFESSFTEPTSFEYDIRTTTFSNTWKEDKIDQTLSKIGHDMTHIPAMGREDQIVQTTSSSYIYTDEWNEAKTLSSESENKHTWDSTETTVSQETPFRSKENDPYESTTSLLILKDSMERETKTAEMHLNNIEKSTEQLFGIEFDKQSLTQVKDNSAVSENTEIPEGLKGKTDSPMFYEEGTVVTNQIIKNSNQNNTRYEDDSLTTTTFMNYPQSKSEGNKLDSSISDRTTKLNDQTDYTTQILEDTEGISEMNFNLKRDFENSINTANGQNTESYINSQVLNFTPNIASETNSETSTNVQLTSDSKYTLQPDQYGVLKYTNEIETNTYDDELKVGSEESSSLPVTTNMLQDFNYRKARAVYPRDADELNTYSTTECILCLRGIPHGHRAVRSTDSMKTERNMQLHYLQNKTNLSSISTINFSTENKTISDVNKNSETNYSQTETSKNVMSKNLNNSFQVLNSKGHNLESSLQFNASTLLEILPLIREGYRNNAFNETDKKVIRSVFGDMTPFTDKESRNIMKESTADMLMGDETSRSDVVIEDTDYDSSFSNDDSLSDYKRKIKRSNKTFKILNSLTSKHSNNLKRKFRTSSSQTLRKIRSSGPQPVSEAAAILALLAEKGDAVQLDIADDEDDDEYEYYEDEYRDDESAYMDHDTYEDDYDEPSFGELIKLARKHRERKAMQS